MDTGDVLELREDRYHFVGRGDGMINVGGMKVYPEEVEAVINGHPGVRDVAGPHQEESYYRRVGSRRCGSEELRNRALTRARFASISCGFCRETLPPHKVPATINFVPSSGGCRDRKTYPPACVM